MMTRRSFGRLASLVLCIGTALTTPAHAQPYPNKPVRLVVPFGPGGAGDIVARLITQKMSQAMGQQFIVENRPGAGGVVATEIVARAEPDGYTLLLLNNGHAISHALFKKLPYDVLKDFSPVTTIGAVSLGLFVASEAPLRTVADFTALAKSQPRTTNLGSINIGSTPHLAAELFKSMTNPELTVVPFNSTGAVLTALRANEIQAGFEFITPVLGQLKAGNLRALAVTTSRRASLLPDVPTLAESGVPGYEAASWNGIAAPAGTPAAVIDRLRKEVHAAAMDSEVRSKLQSMGVEPMLGSPESTRDLLVSEIKKWNAVIDAAKIPRQ